MASQDPSNPKHNPETAPDPDEDDLDDLDEMLDEFQNTKLNDKPTEPAPSATTAAPSSSGPGRPSTAGKDAPSDEAEEPFNEDDFARQLQEDMAKMLKEFEQNPEMAKHFEDMMSQFGAPPTSSAGSKEPSAAPKPSAGVTSGPNANPEDTFQETIRRTMDRMKQSSASASAATQAPEAGEDDIMMNLLREMQNAGEGGDGEDTFSKMLLGMMEQLTNKEILYEPMKELDSKFDGWLDERTTGSKKGELAADDEKRYREQRQLVREIVGRFEKKDYSDGNAEDREFIVERMQKMQAAGAPPPDLVGDMNAAQEMLGDLDGGCPQQ